MSFYAVEKDGVTFYKSTILPCPHAFSTRLGGVSSPAHLKSMNLGENRGDDPLAVKENFRRLSSAADLPPAVVCARQIHSSKVIYAAKPPSDRPSCDGFYTDVPGIALCVKIADCIPLLLFDKGTGSVAALHAGWRGSAANIAGEGVMKLMSLGADPKDIVCAVGTGIGSCCFEVREDFIEEFTALAGKELAKRFVFAREQRHFADLKGLNRYLLICAGLRPENIDVSPLCTCCQPDLFFSHRASGGLRGTMGALIAVNR